MIEKWSKPYRYGNNWRIDIFENGKKQYIIFENDNEAWKWYFEAEAIERRYKEESAL